MMKNESADITLRNALPATGTRLVVLMYDGCIGAVNKAIDAIGRGDLDARCHGVLMATDILAQLHDALDMEKGGQIAENLDRLYRFMIARLQRVNLLNDAAAGREVLGILEPLYDSWRQLDEQLTANAAAATSTQQSQHLMLARAAG